jgi:hypothetical protein
MVRCGWANQRALNVRRAVRGAVRTTTTSLGRSQTTTPSLFTRWLTFGPVKTMYCAEECALMDFLSAWQSAVRWDVVKGGRRKPNLLEAPRTRARIGPARGRMPTPAIATDDATYLFPTKDATMLATEARTSSICAMVAGGVAGAKDGRRRGRM